MEEKARNDDGNADRAVNLVIVVTLGTLLASIYAPMLQWLGHAALAQNQLHNGALIVLFTLVISLRRAIRGGRLQPQANWLGTALIAAGLAGLYLLRWLPGATLPLVLLSFCLAFAGLSAFLFGSQAPRALMPAMAGLLLLGMAAGMAPSLDWPLRSLAAKYGSGFLRAFGIDVRVLLEGGRPPEILLTVAGRVFVVATECNGFGLLASSVLVAAILGLHYRVDWLDKGLLLLVAVPLALLFNSLRIVAICLAATHTPLPYGLIHEGIGIGFYGAALLLLWALARRRATADTPPPADRDG